MHLDVGGVQEEVTLNFPKRGTVKSFEKKSNEEKDY
jgi:hypothetical protein